MSFMNGYLIGGIVGAILGYFVNYLFDFIRKYIKNRCKITKIHKIDKQLQLLNFKNSDYYMPIDHAVPKYKETNIILRESGKF